MEVELELDCRSNGTYLVDERVVVVLYCSLDSSSEASIVAAVESSD